MSVNLLFDDVKPMDTSEIQKMCYRCINWNRHNEGMQEFGFCKVHGETHMTFVCNHFNPKEIKE